MWEPIYKEKPRNRIPAWVNVCGTLKVSGDTALLDLPPPPHLYTHPFSSGLQQFIGTINIFNFIVLRVLCVYVHTCVGTLVPQCACPGLSIEVRGQHCGASCLPPALSWVLGDQAQVVRLVQQVLLSLEPS